MLDATLLGEGAGIIVSAAFVIYAYDALYGDTKPDRLSWLIWMVLGGTLLASYRSSVGQETEAIWVPWVQFVGPCVIFVISWFRGETKLSWYHPFCFVGAGISLSILWVFDQPFVALIAALGSELFGAIPTVVKALKEPTGESKAGWSLSLLASAINLGAIPTWSFAVAAYPFYLFLLTATMTIIVFWPRKTN